MIKYGFEGRPFEDPYYCGFKKREGMTEANGYGKWKNVSTFSNQKVEPLTINTINEAWEAIEEEHKMKIKEREIIDRTLSMQEAWITIEDFRERQKKWKERVEMKRIQEEINESFRKWKDIEDRKDVFSQYFDDMTKYQNAVNKIRSKMLHILNNKGENKMLKVIVKNIETGKHHCIDMPLAQAETYKNLKVGTTVQYYDGKGMDFETCKVEKLIDTDKYAQSDMANALNYGWVSQKGKPPRPGCAPKETVFSEFANTPGKVFSMPMPNPWQKYFYDNIITPRNAMKTLWLYPRKAGKNTMADYVADAQKITKEKKEYQERPYFLARLDTIRGKPEGKENLEKMMFPCYVIWKGNDEDQDKLGQLITGFPSTKIGTQYQLINLTRQVSVGQCCTVDRSVDLKELMDKWFIEVIKGETQMWKIGGVNV